MEKSNNTLKKSPYSIVAFAEECNDNQRSFDVVPTKWISYDDTEDELYCPFISQCTKEATKWLEGLVKDLCPLPSEWEKFKIDVIGYAGKHFKVFHFLFRIGLLSFCLLITF